MTFKLKALRGCSSHHLQRPVAYCGGPLRRAYYYYYYYYYYHYHYHYYKPLHAAFQ